jgi:outer membrane protein assembly factor BamE (lipoprotein component of BamABCDE complex)
MPVFRFLIMVVFPALLAACAASSGNERIADLTQANLSTDIVKGKTTQAQVRQLYGDPIKTSFTDSGNETWEYEFSRLEAKAINYVPYVNLIQSGADGDKKTIVFLFDKNKIVQNYTLSVSKVEVTRGLVTR